MIHVLEKNKVVQEVLRDKPKSGAKVERELTK